MPYSGPGDDALPEYVKALSEDKRAQWVAVWNSAYSKCTGDGGTAKECESSAFAQANGVVIKKEDIRMTIAELWDKIRALFEPEIERAWDGLASNYSSTEQYCAACLIDVNSAAGRDTKAQSHCMLPYKKPGSSAADVEGMHAAAVRFGQVKKPSDVSQDDWDTAVKAAANKLIAAYNSHDETAPESVYTAAGKTRPEERAIALMRVQEQLFAALAERETWAWPMDIYWDEGEMYALVAEEGKLYRVGLAVEGEAVRMGEWVQVTEIHQPVTGRMLVSRQADGSYRWFSIAATAVLNRVGEIDSTALFDNFVVRFAETPAEERPKRDFFHLGEPTVFGDVDLLERDGWCLMASGTFHDTPLGQAMRAAIQAEPERWGDSISYQPLAEAEMVEVAAGVRVPVYSDGVLRFISSLYEKRAASPFTTTTVQEVHRMRQEALAALTGLKEHGLTDEELEKIVDQVDSTNRAIDDGGLIRREQEEEEEKDTDATETPEQEADTDTTDTTEQEPVADREFVLDEEALAAIVERVMGAALITGLVERVAGAEAAVGELRSQLDEMRALSVRHVTETEGRLRTLEADEDQKRREWQADLPARSRTVVTYRPREAKADDGGQPPSLADIANQTLAAWK